MTNEKLKKFKIVVLSDIHGRWNKVKIPECDILISCGDYSFRGEPHMIKDFHKWLDNQPANHIISVQGNHELFVETNFQLAKEMAEKECPGVIFIDEGLVEIEGIKIWCSAITPWFHNWAWNRMRGADIKKHWDKIPDNIDILVTHGPPFNILDRTVRGDLTGCQDMLDKVLQIKPKFHFFGHIHEAYGHINQDGIDFYNVSVCDEAYNAVNKPVMITLIK